VVVLSSVGRSIQTSASILRVQWDFFPGTARHATFHTLRLHEIPSYRIRSRHTFVCILLTELKTSTDFTWNCIILIPQYCKLYTYQFLYILEFWSFKHSNTGSELTCGVYIQLFYSYLRLAPSAETCSSFNNPY
jgi:hypothetical protein